MFFLMDRETQLAIPPKFFGRELHTHIMSELRLKVEGKCSGKYGFTILVTKVTNYGVGELDEDTGCANFQVQYHALVFRPFRNEVLPAEVESVNEKGFFARAGPMELFVSKKCMPEYMMFDASHAKPAFISTDQTMKIEQGSLAIVKIVGIRLAATSINVLGSIDEDFLGPVQE